MTTKRPYFQEILAKVFMAELQFHSLILNDSAKTKCVCVCVCVLHRAREREIEREKLTKLALEKWPDG